MAMSTPSYLFRTAAAEEAATIRYSITVMDRVRAAVVPEELATYAAYELWDECRDHAYDVLTLRGGEELADALLLAVTDEAAHRLLESIEDVAQHGATS